jgi:hypothetical protein
MSPRAGRRARAYGNRGLASTAPDNRGAERRPSVLCGPADLRARAVRTSRRLAGARRTLLTSETRKTGRHPVFQHIGAFRAAQERHGQCSREADGDATGR